MSKETRYTAEFEEFWKLYPERWYEDSDRYYKVGKWDAMLEWKKLDEEDKARAMIAVRRLKVGKYIKDAHRWLHHRRFDDIELPKPKAVLPKQITGNVLKEVPQPVNVNNARNRNMRALERS